MAAVPAGLAVLTGLKKPVKAVGGDPEEPGSAPPMPEGRSQGQAGDRTLGTLARAPVPAHAPHSERFSLLGRWFFLLLPGLMEGDDLPRVPPQTCSLCQPSQLPVVGEGESLFSHRQLVANSCSIPLL